MRLFFILILQLLNDLLINHNHLSTNLGLLNTLCSLLQTDETLTGTITPS